MMILSFAWTMPALLALRKHSTRQHWNHEYAKRWKAGTYAQAWDHLPRAHGQKYGVIRLTGDAYLERTSIFGGPFHDDYENEGFRYMEEMGLLVHGKMPQQFCQDWINADELVYVVRFEVITMDSSRLQEFIKKGRVECLAKTSL